MKRLPPGKQQLLLKTDSERHSSFEGIDQDGVSKSSASTQCTGRTQKGSRCKKMTTNANGRCHLHT
jgi:hypothetical protein